jgi:hypothetical protein
MRNPRSTWTLIQQSAVIDSPSRGNSRHGLESAGLAEREGLDANFFPKAQFPGVSRIERRRWY